MARELGPMSGFRDLLAEQMIPRQAMLDTIRGVYESYGFVPLQTPALELLSTMQGKYGDEGDKLMYSFEDNGGRAVAMRYDQTVPFARVIAQHRGRIPMPYKRYAVGQVWRGERPQAGRYREFTQFDADTAGTTSPIADAEIVAMMSDSMLALGADTVIRVNNRRILDALVEKAGVGDDESTARRLIATIDKVDKIGLEGVLEDVTLLASDRVARLVRDYLAVEGPPKEKLERLSKLLGGSEAMEEGTENLRGVFGMLEASGYTAEKIVFDPAVARGLDYYTGIIYETTLKGAPELGSVCSGGRFDNLIKAMGGPDIPAVGTSIGVDRLYDGLLKLGLTQEAHTNTKVLITNFDANQAPDYMAVATALRAAGLPAEIIYEPTGLGKQLGKADSMGIPYAVFLGPDELARGEGVIKDLNSREQLTVPIAEIAGTIIRLANGE